MTQRFRSHWWSVALADGWEVTQHPECVTLTLHHSGGAFQVSAARKSDGPVEQDELLEIASGSYPLQSAPQRICFGDFAGYSTAFLEDGSYWRKFWLADGSVMIFATYNGPVGRRLLEEPQVLGMLETLRLED